MRSASASSLTSRHIRNVKEKKKEGIHLPEKSRIHHPEVHQAKDLQEEEANRVIGNFKSRRERRLALLATFLFASSYRSSFSTCNNEKLTWLFELLLWLVQEYCQGKEELQGDGYYSLKWLCHGMEYPA